MDKLFEAPYPWVFWLFGYLALLNLVSFAAMALDKRRARRGEWRIPERSLLLLDFLGGSLGGLLGMALCRHKTKHLRFAVLVPLCFILHTALLCLLYFFWKGCHP